MTYETSNTLIKRLGVRAANGARQENSINRVLFRIQVLSYLLILGTTQTSNRETELTNNKLVNDINVLKTLTA